MGSKDMLKEKIFARVALGGAGYLEKAAGLARGKGFGSYSVKQEVNLALKALGRTPQLVIDGGGNAGEYAAAVHKRAPMCEIVIFEPAGFNVDRMNRRFKNIPSIRVEANGLSDSARSATLFANEEGSGVASLSRRNLEHLGIEFNHQEEISLVAFDDFWRENLACRPIDLLKLDIEGHELQALHGAEASLLRTKVIQFEFGGCNIDSRTYFQDFYYLLKGLDFEIFRISPIGVEKIRKYSADLESFTTTNFLGVRC